MGLDDRRPYAHVTQHGHGHDEDVYQSHKPKGLGVKQPRQDEIIDQLQDLLAAEADRYPKATCIDFFLEIAALESL